MVSKGNWDEHFPFAEFSYNNNYHSIFEMTLFESFYGRRCKFHPSWLCFFDRDWVRIWDNKKVWLIRKRLKMTQILDKSYINVEQEFLSFILMIGSIWKAVMRFGKKQKLSPHYMGTYQIFRRIDKVSYELELSNFLASVLLIFHISLLKKCVGDSTSCTFWRFECLKYHAYEKIPVEILHQQGMWEFTNGFNSYIGS